MSGEGEEPPQRRSGWGEAGTLFLLCAVAAAIAYVLLSAVVAGSLSGTISLTFLLVLPAALSALISYGADPSGTRSLGFYAAMPFLSWIAVVAAGALALGEGVLCILMLTPLWLLGGLVGSILTYSARRRMRDRRRLFAGTALLLPLLSAQIEAALPVPVE